MLRANESSGAVLVSAVLHVALAAGVVLMRPYVEQKHVVPVTVKIVKVEKPKPQIAEVKKEPPPIPPPPPPEKKLPKKKIETKKLASERKPAEKPVEPAKPVQGLSPTALTPGAHGIAVPAGNTLMVEDDGKRVAPQDVKPLSNEDLSADARLIVSTMTPPKYTDDAVDANVEGYVVVEVYVDEQGQVAQAELRKKIGYGMDERMIDAARKARFTPRKDRYGRGIAGWTEIKFHLEIPG